ncbi:CDP-alcohol phosphatidyltransferase family protein [Candidatus Micrarchaeota archaeon]|nr:CDP-alcohol phosphatidyltransferase family protein [Candidatus Micrarchaeota archaeon]MBU1886663.1 CDP-alcohol phosphatidyltransferase family protein [Candidatus Micrarchaeota archaeon]
MLKQNTSITKIQDAIGRLLSGIPLTPNQWTLLSLLVAFVAAGFIAFFNNLFIGLFLFVLAGALDMVDGAVARARGTVSKFGGFIDGVADRFVEASFLFSFMFYPLPTVFIDPKIWVAAVMFFGTSMPSFIRAYADHKEIIEKKRALALSGICERSERIIILVVGLLAGISYSMEFFIYALMLISLLSLITILQRLIEISGTIKE